MQTTEKKPTIMVNNILKTVLVLLTMLMCFQCDNDDGNAPNENECNYEGFSFEWNNNTHTTYSESILKAEYFSSQGAIEIWDTTNPGNTFIVTTALSAGEVDSNPEIRIEGNDYSGTITCQRISGTNVGDEIRYDIVINGTAEAEFCGDIDTVN